MSTTDQLDVIGYAVIDLKHPDGIVRFADEDEALAYAADNKGSTEPIPVVNFDAEAMLGTPDTFAGYPSWKVEREAEVEACLARERALIAEEGR
jgi:hypothetical protein